MEVIKIQPQGYCLGVTKALNLVKKAIKENPDKVIYLLGMIVHNDLINQALLRQGVKLLSSNKAKQQWIEELNAGILIISAHGVNPDLIKKAEEKGLIVYDATCQHVKVAQQMVTDYLAQDFDIIYIGEPQHPEAQGIISIAPARIHLVNQLSDIADLRINNERIIVITQTTINHQAVQELFANISVYFPQALISGEICAATKQRQAAVCQLAEDLDLLFVVGDKSSNNANKLVEIGQNKGIKQVYLVTSVADIVDFDFNNIKKVGVTSAASTPPYLTNQLISYLQTYPEGKIPALDLEKIL